MRRPVRCARWRSTWLPLETRGTPVPVVPNVVTTGDGGMNAVVAADGTLAYVSGAMQSEVRTLVWVDRRGHVEPLKAAARAYVYPRLSPDGTRVAVEVRPARRRKCWRGRNFFGTTGAGATGFRTYDVSLDGQRFLMIKLPEESEPAATSVNFVQNWTEELKRLVPAK